MKNLCEPVAVNGQSPALYRIAAICSKKAIGRKAEKVSNRDALTPKPEDFALRPF